MQAVPAHRHLPAVVARPVQAPGVTGDVRRVEHFPADELGGERDLVMYLPPGYDAPGNRQRYPVVYLQDGQNLFDPRTAFLGREWHLDETAEGLIREGRIPPLILVGVYNGGDRRIDEYTPVPDPKEGGGHADAYGDFLMKEVKPWVDARFRTKADAGHTAIVGSSLGGLVSLYLSWKHPDVFGMAGALSPSLWWADRELTRAVRADHATHGPRRIWLDMGTAETTVDQDGNGVPDTVDDVRDMRDALEEKGYREGDTLRYREVEGGTHDEASWAERADEVLEALTEPESPAERK